MSSLGTVGTLITQSIILLRLLPGNLGTVGILVTWEPMELW